MTTITKKEEKSTAPATQQTTAVQKQTLTPSERFTAMVMKQFAGIAGSAPDLTGYQKRLIQNYFLSTDMALKAAEDKRLKRSKNNQDPVPVTWENVNLEDLAMDVVAYSKVGLDPALANHLSMIPYKNNKTGKYDIGFIEGYRGKELKAKKYGFDVPDNVIVEVVYSNDTFKPLKKDARREVESFEFSVSDNPFDRGEVVGGFYYHEYYVEPRKNKLMFYNKAEIDKRKPQYASVEFWGGEKDKWTNNQRVGTEHVEGWYVEMVWKTLFRMAYNIIPIDGEKIDDNLMRILAHEKEIEAVREQDPGEALADRRDAQIRQSAGTKKLDTAVAADSDEPEGNTITMPTDVEFEEIGESVQESNDGSLFGSEACSASKTTPGF
jgi:recombination protein RecT